MSAESLEFWKNLFESIGVVVLLLTFIAGAGALWFNRKLNAVQAQQLRQFDRDLTDAKTALGKQQERAANAESALFELQQKMTTVETGVSLIPAINERINNLQHRLSAANKANDPAEVDKLKNDLSDAKTAKIVLSKQVISNAWLVVSQLRESARNWNAEEAHAKDEKERERIHGAWNHRDPLGNARPATLQLLALLPETSSSDRLKEIQLQDMKLHGQAFGGTGPEPLQGDADYLEALIQRVIAANPELAK